MYPVSLRYLDLSTPEEITVIPGILTDVKFDKRVVAKWQETIFLPRAKEILQRVNNCDSPFNKQ